MASSASNQRIYTDSCEAARQPLVAHQCALVVVDIQEKLLPPIFNRDPLLHNAQLLIRLARILALPVMATTQYAKGLGRTVPEIAELLAELPSPPLIVDKVEFGCFANPAFSSAAHALPGEPRTMLLCGMETHICVMQTALGALNQGYRVHVASDAVGSRSESNWQLGLDRMAAAGAVVSSTEMMIYELLGGSGTAAFRQMLPFLKG